MKANPREPAVAGAFYPGSESELQNQLQGLVSVQEMRHQLLACIAPHAGYIYSGSVAGTLFGHLDVPRRVVILGPNHTGMGGAMAVASHPKWRTPLGDVAVDLEFSRMLIESHQPAAFDDIAHRQEHSLEVQLPLLLARQPELQFVPICLGHLSLDDCLELGLSIARLISGIGKTVGIVASSDMSHYLPDGEARTQDRMAIDAALARDPEALYKIRPAMSAVTGLRWLVTRGCASTAEAYSIVPCTLNLEPCAWVGGRAVRLRIATPIPPHDHARTSIIPDREQLSRIRPHIGRRRLDPDGTSQCFGG
jgi:AmmeMemoRadiSam system protein B